jgi:hypothetical protein
MAAIKAEYDRRLWDAADDLRANSKLKSSEYSIPVLGLIFLRYADYKFEQVEKDLSGRSSRRRTIGKADYQARGVLFLRDAARFAYLLKLPEGANIGAAINAAMKAIEEENEDPRDPLPALILQLIDACLAKILPRAEWDHSGPQPIRGRRAVVDDGVQWHIERMPPRIVSFRRSTCSTADRTLHIQSAGRS